MAYSKTRTGHLRQGRNDTIVTPGWVASDMVEHFAPTGRVLEPCMGDGAIFRHLPKDADWCEITKGRDFFDWKEPVDWVLTNPPYSDIRGFFRHAMTLASDIVFLIPVWKAFTAEGFFRELETWGGNIAEIRRYGTGAKLGFPMGNAIGAVHISKNSFETRWSRVKQEV